MSEHEGEDQERPEWYERLREDQAFPGRRFASEQMDRIERRALGGEGRRLSMRLRWSGVGAAACVVALAIWFGVAGPSKGNSPDGLRAAVTPEPSMAPSAPSTTTSQEPEPRSTTEVHMAYFVKGAVQALPEPQPFSTMAVYTADTEGSYWIADSSGQDYVQIVDLSGAKGWVPLWYMTSDRDNAGSIEQVQEPYEMIVDKPVKYRSYPEEPEPSGFELWQGKVVQVVSTYGEDWVEIEVVTYDSPYAGNKWVRKDELIPYEESKAMEGFVFAPDVTLYDEKGTALQVLPILTNLYIEGERGNRYKVIAGGGISGYLDKIDFVANPFAIRVTDQ